MNEQINLSDEQEFYCPSCSEWQTVNAKLCIIPAGFTDLPPCKSCGAKWRVTVQFTNMDEA